MSEKTETPRRRPVLRVIAALVIVAVAVAVGLLVSLGTVEGLLFRPVRPEAADATPFVVEIRPNQTLRTVSRTLANDGVVRSAIVLEIYGRYMSLDSRLQAGRYLVSPSMAPAEILQKITSGDAVFDTVSVTIPEGWSLNDIEVHFEELGLFSKERFAEAAVMQPAYRDFELLAALEDDTILDGYLFPDTYTLFEDSTPETVVKRMLSNFDRRLTPEIRARIDASEKTLHEVLTLASMVQGEATNEVEMRDVAGVFTNRLRDGIRLESDATVNYVLGTSKRQPTFADTEVEHPYNTYENYGLPPGPIGNPGIDAILASLDPAEHEYYFFLHPLGQPIVLSRTFAEHLENKARYLD